MRTAIFLATILTFTPSFGQTRSDATDLRGAVLANAIHLSGMVAKETEGLGLREYAIANVTVAHGRETFQQFAYEQFSNQLADELIAGYVAVSQAPTQIDAAFVEATPVLPLDTFANGVNTYDWSRLNVTYPEVKAVIRISDPVVLSGVFAVARYEVIAPSGPSWARIQKFEKRGDGRWVATVAHLGNLWR